MAKNCPAVSAEYQEAIEKARRKLHALIAQHNCASLMFYLACKFDVSRTGHTFEMTMTKTKPTEHGLVANAGIDQDIAVKMLEAIKGEFPVISDADLCQLAGAVAVEMSSGPDTLFQPESDLTDSVDMEVSGGLDLPFHLDSELAGSAAIKVSDGREIPRQPQENEVMEVAAETLVPIDEMVRSIRVETKIPRFPRGLHRTGGQDNRYIIPSVVALGPYYHDLPQLQEMEKEKRAAARYLCMRSGRSFDEVYGNILSIVHQARSCYVDTTVAHLSDEDFAKMMLFDGCFLLRYIMENVECARLENRMTLPPGPSVLRDIFLLENQLPWLVLEALVTFNYDTMYQFVARMAGSFDITAKTESSVNQSYKPPHLLGLLRHHQIGNLFTEEFSFNDIRSSLASSAIELAEIGIKLTASKKTWFADTSIQKGLLFGKLPLTPLVLSDFTASWLVNMVAFEVCLSTSYLSDGYTICSYLSLLAMLMDKVEDVHALRAQHLLRSSFSNQETLDFLKGLAHDLPVGHRYMAILKKIEEYKCQRTVRIVVHKFIYNNYKTILTLFSVGGVIASIFFGCMSLKQHTGSRHVG